MFLYKIHEHAQSYFCITPTFLTEKHKNIKISSRRDSYIKLICVD